MPRPKKLQTVIIEHVHESILESGKVIIKDILEDKLKEQGFETEAFPIEDLMSHLLSGNENTFSWDDGNKTNKTIQLDFTDKDVDRALSELQCLQIDYQAIVSESMAKATVDTLRKLERNFAEEKALEEIEFFGFKTRLQLQWGRPLDLFRMLLTMSLEIHMCEQESLNRSRAKKKQTLRDALIGIHARAWRTSKSVLVLLENGLADDAYTRWRTLYELCITANILAEFGDDIAERYINHESIVYKRILDNSSSWGNKFTNYEKRHIDDEYELAIQRYGKSFAKPYGWACTFVDDKDPTFSDLEKHVAGRRILPSYKESSLQVHGGRAGLHGLGSSEELLVIGHSNKGLEIPLINSSRDLVEITTILHENSPSRDLVIQSIFWSLHSKIDWNCRRIASQLSREIELESLD